MPPSDSGPVIFFDGECPLCCRAARFALWCDRRRRLRFAPLGGATAAAFFRRHPGLDPAAGGADSMLLVSRLGEPGEAVLSESDAVLAMGRELGVPWAPFARLAALVPRRWRDFFYRFIARRRPRGAACPLPSAENSLRFLP